MDNYFHLVTKDRMLLNFKKPWSQWLDYLLVAFLIFVTLWLHLVNLGYSDYQGDEISYAVLGHLSLFKFRETYPVLLWFLFPWEVLELVIYDPGTHIYTYVIPATISLGFGLLTIEGWKAIYGFSDSRTIAIGMKLRLTSPQTVRPGLYHQ
jgi:hypothetical protein